RTSTFLLLCLLCFLFGSLSLDLLAQLRRIPSHGGIVQPVSIRHPVQEREYTHLKSNLPYLLLRPSHSSPRFYVGVQRMGRGLCQQLDELQQRLILRRQFYFAQIPGANRIYEVLICSLPSQRGGV